MKNLKISLKYAFILYLFSISLDTSGQKTINEQYQNWTQYFINLRIKENWSINSDVFFRWKELDGRKLQSGIRASITYHFKQPISASAGYVYFIHYPSTSAITITKHEHRPWQQILITTKKGRIQLQHRYRFEQRFIERASNTQLIDGYTFNFRLRYQLAIQVPINKKEIEKGVIYGLAYNEIFVNFGKEIVYNYFDQNRTSVGLGYQFSRSFAATLGYQYIWQQLTNGDKFNSISCVRLALIHSLDLRKKEPN